MLFRVAERLVAGDVLPIQLTFANHPDLLIELPVRKH